MSLTRFAPQLAQAFRLLVAEPAMLLRCAAFWLVLALAGRFTVGMALPPVVPFALNALALGAFAVAWQRFVALQEKPKGPVALAVGPRHLAWALSFQVFLGFELVVGQLLAALLADQDNSPALVMAGTQLFQMLIGAMLLLLPHVALWRKQDPGARLQELVMAAGLAVGLGYVLSRLPFTLAETMVGEAFAMVPQSPATGVLHIVALLLVQFVGVAVMAGYYALVWKELRATVKPMVV